MPRIRAAERRSRHGSLRVLFEIADRFIQRGRAVAPVVQRRGPNVASIEGEVVEAPAKLGVRVLCAGFLRICCLCWGLRLRRAAWLHKKTSWCTRWCSAAISLPAYGAPYATAAHISIWLPPSPTKASKTKFCPSFLFGRPWAIPWAAVCIPYSTNVCLIFLL